jgi:hypothetical protein
LLETSTFLNLSPKNISITIGCIFCTLNSFAQSPTLGLLHYDPLVSHGYTLFTPELNNSAYLVDNCGQKVNEWTFSEVPGLTCYLLENGTLLRAGKDSLEIRDWDNTLLWSYATSDNGLKQHHDIEPLPNGNILLVVMGFYGDSIMTSEGRNPASLVGNLKLDQIIELEPVGTNSANIVWQWNFIDHLVQDFDSLQENYNLVENHPELLDINFDNGNDIDWVHVNAVDYNAALDQILISARHLNEIYIIDHSTTTAQAASHSGGNSGRGGDFLWRWGNPQVYRQGTSADQKLFKQHDARWVPDGYVDEHKISVFNNTGNGVALESYLHLIEPEIVGVNYTMLSNAFLPASFDWTWGGMLLGHTLYQSKKSGCHALPNGSFIVTETTLGTASEILKDGTVLWSYRNPTGQSGVYNQFDVVNLNLNSLFRAEKYQSDYIGFTGKDLTPQGIIEDDNSNSDLCILVGVEDVELDLIKLKNPINDGFIRFTETIYADMVMITDISGQNVCRKVNFSGDHIQVNTAPGVYLIQISMGNQITSRKIIML